MAHASLQDPPQADAATQRQFDLACKALSEVPNKFRAIGTWVSYFSLLYHLAPTDKTKTLLLNDLDTAISELDQVMRWFDPLYQPDDVPKAAFDWFHACLAQTTERGETFRDFAVLLRRAHYATNSTLDQAVAVHMELLAHATNRFAPELAELFGILGKALNRIEQDRRNRVDVVRRGSAASVADIVRISQMVRLISLNASVEAARAGDAGRTFGVIAQEITQLSDSIRASSNDVSGTIENLMETL